jgi:hypothetical protein
VLWHIPYLISKLGNLRALSARSLERKIGTAKRSVKSTKHAGVNAGNILEKEEIFGFLSMAEIIDFSAPLGSGNPNIENTFRYHPSCIEGDINYNEYKNRPQQWNPFPKSVIFSDILEQPNKRMEKLNISNGEYKKAILDYLGYITGSLSPRFSHYHKHQQVDFSERLWSDSMVYCCTSYKEKCDNKTRRDDHCYFTSNHINE